MCIHQDIPLKKQPPTSTSTACDVATTPITSVVSQPVPRPHTRSVPSICVAPRRAIPLPQALLPMGKRIGSHGSRCVDVPVKNHRRVKTTRRNCAAFGLKSLKNNERTMIRKENMTSALEFPIDYSMPSPPSSCTSMSSTSLSSSSFSSSSFSTREGENHYPSSCYLSPSPSTYFVTPSPFEELRAEPLRYRSVPSSNDSDNDDDDMETGSKCDSTTTERSLPENILLPMF